MTSIKAARTLSVVLIAALCALASCDPATVSEVPQPAQPQEGQVLEEEASPPDRVEDSPIVDILKIAGKDKAAVAKALGEPSKCTEVNPSRVGKSPKCAYGPGKAEVVFIDGKADWIFVEDLEGAPFSHTALARVGLDPTVPQQSNQFMKSWRGIHGFREVKLFQGKGKAGSLNVKVKTD